uniref:Thioredoxin family protein n=1 Tax=candidate division WOR-3 bacterium TaxID=2052148 RepID=A0A7C3EZB2_UNCW3
MNIQILGIGCPRCQELEKRVIDTLAELGIAANVEKVTDIKKFASMGVFMTPGLVIDGRVVSQGKVLTKEELKKLIGGQQ